MKIHPTAIVEDGAELDSSVEVGPYSVVRRGARIGAGTRLHSHVNIWGQTTIGTENEIYPFCMIGPPPQIVGDTGPESQLTIGNRNIIREAVEIHRAGSKYDKKTEIGDDNFIMSSVHIAHDCKIGNRVIIATKTGIAGHVQIKDNVIISGACGLAQFVRIGSYTFCAGMTRFEKDLPPFMCAREFSEITGPNLVGLKRSGFKEEDIRTIKEIFKTLFVEPGLFRDQLENLRQRFAGQKVFDMFYGFVTESKVGIMRRQS